MRELHIGAMAVRRIELTDADLLGHRTRGVQLIPVTTANADRGSGAVSLAATRSILGGRPVDVEDGLTKTRTEKSRRSPSDGAVTAKTRRFERLSSFGSWD